MAHKASSAQSTGCVYYDGQTDLPSPMYFQLKDANLGKWLGLVGVLKYNNLVFQFDQPTTFSLDIPRMYQLEDGTIGMYGSFLRDNKLQDFIPLTISPYGQKRVWNTDTDRPRTSWYLHIEGTGDKVRFKGTYQVDWTQVNMGVAGMNGKNLFTSDKDMPLLDSKFELYLCNMQGRCNTPKDVDFSTPVTLEMWGGYRINSWNGGYWVDTEPYEWVKFRIVKGLWGIGTWSIIDTRDNTYLYPDSTGRVVNGVGDGSNQWKSSATFKICSPFNGAPNSVSFQSYAKPGHYLRGRDGMIWVEAKVLAVASYEKDASWKINNELI